MLSATIPGMSSRNSPILPLSRPSSRNSSSPHHSSHNIHISAPRGSFSGARASGPRLPLFFKRLFKYPQMDFEMAIWEMTCLIIAPKKVFRSIYYHKQMKNTWAKDDPSFVVLLSFFLLLTGIAWGFAYTRSFGSVVRLMTVLIFGHFLLVAALVATAGWFLAGRFLRVSRTGGIGGNTVASAHGEGELEWAYCFDVAVRAFFVSFFFLYVIQFIAMPILTRNYWISLFLGNSLYLVALSFYCIITFLGYNVETNVEAHLALPFLHHTEIFLFPIFIFIVLWAVSLFGFNIAKHITPFVLGVGV